MEKHDIIQISDGDLDKLRRQLISLLITVEDLMSIPENRRACLTREQRRKREGITQV